KDVTNGAVVMGVDAFSPAGKAGLKELDVITEFDGHKVNDIVDLRKRLYQKKVGDRVKVRFYRGGKEKSVDIKLSSADQLGS
ncbi:PDZ domain-containing protein, partial [Bacillus inaquosorum]